MEILPARIQPPTRLIARKHRPKPASARDGYRRFRQCLRWEFGFTCALCLVHESDLVPSGVEGSGITTIEHMERQETSPELVNVYENCLYACKHCNQARGIRPRVNEQGERLLEPTSAVWSEHFVAEGDRLRPRPGDGDAEYTHRAYDLDSPTKVTIRANRRKHIDYCLRVVREAPELLGKLEALLARGAGARGTEELRSSVELTRATIHRAWEELQRYAAIPADRGMCRCESPPALELPDVFAEQQVGVDHPAGQIPGT